MNHKPKRPGALIAAAVIMLLAGSWSILGGICGSGSIALLEVIELPRAPGQPDPLAPHRFLTKEVPGYLPVIFTMIGIDAILGIAKIVAAIGLLRLSSMARTMSLLLIALGLLIALAGTVYNCTLLLPAQARFAADHPEHGGVFVSGLIGVIVGVSVNLAIAIVTLVLLNMKSTKEAIAAAGQPPVEEEERPRSRYEGYDDDAPPETGITDRDPR